MYKREMYRYIKYLYMMASNVRIEDQGCCELAKGRKAVGFFGVYRESIWGVFVAETDGVVVAF